MTRCPRCGCPAVQRDGRLTCGICALDIEHPLRKDGL